ncbi:serine/threonine protein kinase [Fischerella thermalis WC558]|uniref:serine/threonine protein kinase n=1 Tax=Fischerella thermalis TaxID=372787 RepID=UPI000C80466F|nr:serine/threonine-protein kinase [Fischerella thermalis]PLZ37823.1 serine/threonine protein kinase [Fischerella thermalis WC558]PLZ55112.1 serine/threonine protein kinase [Fischerella thermalis WC439]
MLQNEIHRQVRQKTELDTYIGKFLNNRYLIRDLIGKGGMGRVYLAEDVAKGGMAVAVKILSMNLANQQLSQRFAREIFIGAQLGRKSTHIVRVLSYGVTEDKIPYYVMEYLQGKNLKQILKNETLKIPNILEICHQICLGLQCAHQGVSIKGEIFPVIHRDIKPENIFIIEDDSKDRIVKILDFGIAKFLTEGTGITLAESFIGSLPYCSPEHMEGRKLLDVRSDIYSLGVLMFEMLTGKHPFQIKSNSFSDWYQAHRFEMPPMFENIAPQISIPKELKNLVMACLAKEVSDRPQDISQILVVLEQLQRKYNNLISDKQKNIQNQELLHLVPVMSLSEKICLQKSWPKNQPIAPICFSHLLPTPQGSVPTFWAMLAKKEIAKFIDNNNYTEFIFQKNLYPMILWITVLSDAQFQLTRWLSCFLDLKDIKGQKLVQNLVNTGYYHLLFFALEDPTLCVNVITLTLSAFQRQQLLDWLDYSQKVNTISSLNESKTILKTEYEKIKSDILQKLVNKQKQTRFNIKYWLLNLYGHILSLFPRSSLIEEGRTRKVGKTKRKLVRDSSLH